ncbi:3-deoxy-manno-octulosonate cytidylyltransferase [Endomicrobium proavitum]|uniref:3-deoxy-manno-octulosonate cytidylyltransferase n=1 Tax=Endomicrobium proavitum TaxID=1408281 RepID=A0A0G3WFS2_9BACT|nr:3-deoxy-manno-octulosonate cytidylyltransferase [Endomicrobium proavitum]AKL97456.1 3-deoxy-manno-octulosonate cytidylyltransferase [Endomicrobium proavitum]
MKTAAVIPSRYASTRFPGKPLALVKAKPLVQRVIERVQKCKNVDLVAVATDDKRIFDAVTSLGYKAFMTPQSCKSGTDRIAYVAKKYLKNYDIFLNVQGDEPLIDYMLADKLASELKNSKAEYVTAAFPITDVADIRNPNAVKVVLDSFGFALYFSRLPVPYNRDGAKVKYYKHMGIYGYTRNFLLNFSKMRPSVLEKAESLEQLRALSNGKKIKVVIVKQDSIGVDVPADVKRVEKLLRK